MKEEYAIILDYLPTGYPGSRRPLPIAQAIGTKYFSLLELVPKDGVTLEQEEKVYIGEGKRDKIKLIRHRLTLGRLTNVAHSVLEEILDSLIKENESRFVEFFNRAGTITPRLHQLELLPGIGKRYVEKIISNRPYNSFEDLKKKTDIPDPIKVIRERILKELEGKEKYYLFVAPPHRPRFGRRF